LAGSGGLWQGGRGAKPDPNLAKPGQIRQSPRQRKSKKKACISLDWLRRIEPFQGLAPTPPGKFFLPLRLLHHRLRWSADRPHEASSIAHIWIIRKQMLENFKSDEAETPILPALPDQAAAQPTRRASGRQTRDAPVRPRGGVYDRRGTWAGRPLSYRGSGYVIMTASRADIAGARAGRSSARNLWPELSPIQATTPLQRSAFRAIEARALEQRFR